MCAQPLHVLVVDDAPQMRRWLQTSLKAHGYQVLEASNGQDALLRTTTVQVDVILLDLDLPDLYGLEVIRRIREGSTVPIIVVSVHSGEREKIAALDGGADDYVTKPFSMEELLARIRATIRHRLHATIHEPVFRSAALTVDLGRRLVLLGQAEVKLTPTQYELLRVLVLHAGHVVTHHDLLREVWGPDAVCAAPCLRVHISHIRQKLEPNRAQPQYIFTEPGIGYRLRARDTETVAQLS
jgi:two-component system, OmpR family, KDP operon response regulator KdpE